MALVYLRQPFPRVTLAELTFHLFLCKIQPTVYKRTQTRLGGRDNSSGLASAGRVTLAGRTTFLHKNTLAHLSETIVSVASVTECLDLGFKAEICIKEVKISSTKATLIES